MDNWIKGLRVIICIILLAVLCACSVSAPNGRGTRSTSQPYSSELTIP